jgi:hypothetical protein
MKACLVVINTFAKYVEIRGGKKGQGRRMGLAMGYKPDMNESLPEAIRNTKRYVLERNYGAKILGERYFNSSEIQLYEED